MPYVSGLYMSYFHLLIIFTFYSLAITKTVTWCIISNGDVTENFHLFRKNIAENDTIYFIYFSVFLSRIRQ